MTAQKEIARVLKPGGRLIAMLYARRSLNYLLAISVVRRLGIAVLYLASSARGSGIVGGHIANAKRDGACGSTSGCPTSFTPTPTGRSIRTVRFTIWRLYTRIFLAFALEKSYQDYMHAPPLPYRGSNRLRGVLGWHLWVHLIPRKSIEHRRPSEP